MRGLLYIALTLLTTTASAQVDAAALEQATLTAIAERAPDMADHVLVSVVRLPSNRDESAPGELKVELPQLPLIPKGRMQVRLSRTGEPAGTAMINVAHYDSVGVLAAPLALGADLASGELRFVWMETTRFPGEPLTRSALASWGSDDIVARRSLRADRPLRVSDLESRPAADTGDPVRMTYRRGAFVLELSCRARDRGRIGDIIRLYADDSDTMYRARLTGPARAEWVETL